jgi:hypothetical protein
MDRCEVCGFVTTWDHLGMRLTTPAFDWRLWTPQTYCPECRSRIVIEQWWRLEVESVGA